MQFNPYNVSYGIEVGSVLNLRRFIMASLFQYNVNVIGRLVKDVEFGETKAGKTWARFTLVTNTYFKVDGQELPSQHAEWHNAVCFDKVADVAVSILEKDGFFNIEGYIKVERYLDKSGKEAFAKKVVVSRIHEVLPHEKPAAAEDDDSDIPF